LALIAVFKGEKMNGYVGVTYLFLYLFCKEDDCFLGLVRGYCFAILG